ncbi:MAG: DUF2017 domain-containing protein [Acidimicrobiia bacterium]|nr:DUF2017 domain-containing protein [Acidimicrobiia bacterium]MBT8193462.1 DUF2017 domain-containing protein [Acidimicrobiia bacterium]MBT8247084.1 DUF2017 domain-containing protein [Acidimicrobiia bacterium]NNF89000.1 DUF2017 family protein [Acidimicrobiia bacterium]NNJ48070.1 DUF2017 family protein [Acidimicrobiia bacterium]
MRRPFKAHHDGVAVRLSDVEREFLLGLPILLTSVDAEPDDPAYVRLHVAAYPDDPAAQEEMTEYSGSQLAEARTSDRERFTATLEAGQSVLSPDEAESWLTVLGDARLALAARLGIEEPGWEVVDEEDPERITLGFLSYLQDQLVTVLMRRL